ncbi:ankyrin repeat domain-containing protein 2 isoform X1 [Phalacrocorax aristotelis]|uniref:ankyrin repeat domain-containing protein 2 isoform X1 n=1 Tax=Phalacrocorax aristotelis TaxID=126867 RepID=UPI003F4BD007
MAKLPQSCGAVTAVSALGQWNGGDGSIKPHSQRNRRQHQEPGLGAPCPLWQGGEAASGRGCAPQADMELDVQRAKELIEQKLAEEEEEKRLKGGGYREPPAVERMNTPELEEEKHRGPRNWGLEAVKGQDRVRKSSVDLRREIIDVGSIQRLIELRKQRRQRREERAATPEPPPPPEPLEIEGPVEPETFLRAAVQGKMRVIEKFLADGGSPDTCDEFHRTALHRSSLEGHTDILQKLLDSGATVDFRDRLDCTAVHWACRGGHLDAVKLLQDHGADLNLKDKVCRAEPAGTELDQGHRHAPGDQGWPCVGLAGAGPDPLWCLPPPHIKLLSTPLHVATRTGHLDIVEHLIHCGVDINSPDREGDTALHDATRLSRYKIIKMLILHGADMMAKNQPLSAHSCRLARPRRTWCSSGRWTHARRWRPRSNHRERRRSLHDGTGQGPGTRLSSKKQDPAETCPCQ